MGVYVGSSSNRRGARARIQEHKRVIRQARQRETTFRRKSHYEFASRSGTVSHFKQVARCPNGDKHFGSVSHYIEGLMMVLLNLVNDPIPAEGEPDGIVLFDLYNPQTAAFMEILRREVAESCGDLPNFKSSALNNAWSLSQGFNSSLKTRPTWGTRGNCGSENGLYGDGAERRCVNSVVISGAREGYGPAPGNLVVPNVPTNSWT
ncbi:hypothetical protein V8F33_004739 [Rhypophila sp. PSN 637]